MAGLSNLPADAAAIACRRSSFQKFADRDWPLIASRKGFLVTATRPGEELAYNADGSLVIHLQPDDPGPRHCANWLPTPSSQAYELSLRAYWQDQSLLDGRWTPPPIVPAEIML
jgi:hypothetical protein